MQVAIVGAGIGGLALAQGLKQAGVEVRLYERDPSPTIPQAGLPDPHQSGGGVGAAVGAAG